MRVASCSSLSFWIGLRAPTLTFLSARDPPRTHPGSASIAVSSPSVNPLNCHASFILAGTLNTFLSSTLPHNVTGLKGTADVTDAVHCPTQLKTGPVS